MSDWNMYDTLSQGKRNNTRYLVILLQISNTPVNHPRQQSSTVFLGKAKGERDTYLATRESKFTRANTYLAFFYDCTDVSVPNHSTWV